LARLGFPALWVVGVALAACIAVQPTQTVIVAPNRWTPFTCVSWRERHIWRNACYHSPGECAKWRDERRNELPSSCVGQDAAACTIARTFGSRELCFSNAEQCERFRVDFAAEHGDSTACETRRF
jgi:hypothetical protein